MDFRAATTVFRATSIIILTGTIGTRTFITIHTPEIHFHIIPRRPDPRGTVGIAPTVITATAITTATNQALVEAEGRDLTPHDVYGKNSARWPRIHLARDQT